MMKSKGFVGTLGVHTNLASSGCVCSASSIHMVLLTIKIPLSVKCKCPHKVIIHPSKKSYKTSGTKAPSKLASHSGGNCENLSLIESMNDDSRQPKGKGAEYMWRPTLAHRKMGGRGPVDGIETI
jgi:hypothetical protein